MKKLLSLIITTAMIMTSFVAVHGDENNIEVLLDGQTIEFDVPPQIVEARTLVPFRAIFEALGYKVDWDGDAQTVMAFRMDRTITMQIGNDTAVTAGEYGDSAEPVNTQIALDVPPQIIGERTFVPVRAVAEMSNYDVQWDEKTYTVIITSPADDEEAGNTDNAAESQDSLKYHIEYDETNEIASSRAKNFEIINIDKNDNGDFEITYTLRSYREDSGDVIISFNCLDKDGRRIGGFSDMFHSWAYSWTPQEGTAVIPGNTVKIELAKDE